MKTSDIRYGHYADCEPLSRLIATVIEQISYYNDLAKKTEIEKFTAGNLKEKINDDPYSDIIASLNGEITGFCLSRFDDFVIWLEWFGVAPTQRKRGVANRLLQKVEESVPARNCHKIWCDCRTDNVASIRLLAHNGYQQLLTIQNHWYQQDFILWQKFTTA